MRSLGRLACLAAAGLFVVTALEAQKPAPKPAPVAAKPAAAAKSTASPKIEISPETKDAGTVAKGQMVEATFVVHNGGGSDLVISDARPSCGCTVASFDKVIKPGQDGKIQSSVDTKSFSGPISKSVLVVSNDPDRPQMNLFIKAMVKPFVDVLPQAFVRFSVIKGDNSGQDDPRLREPPFAELVCRRRAGADDAGCGAQSPGLTYKGPAACIFRHKHMHQDPGLPAGLRSECDLLGPPD